MPLIVLKKTFLNWWIIVLLVKQWEIWEREVRLVNNAGDYKKYVSKPSFVSPKRFSKNFVVVHEIEPVLTLDKPIYVGFSILDLSKMLMYEFHYIKIHQKKIWC